MKKELPRYTVEARARLFGEESAAASALREADSRAKAGEEVAFFDAGDTILVGPRTSESSSKRPSGFYRVKEEGKWTVAKFDARFDRWESMGEVSVAQQHREYKRADGSLYTGPIGGGVYGHAACLQSLGPFAN